MELDNVPFYKYSWTPIRVPKGIYILFIILKAEFQLPCIISLPYPHFSYLTHIKITFNLTYLVSSNRSCEKNYNPEFSNRDGCEWACPLSTAWQAGSNYVKLVIKKERKKKKIRVAGLDIDSYTTILIHKVKQQLISYISLVCQNLSAPSKISKGSSQELNSPL